MKDVDWKPYPETHPTKNGFYLVTLKIYDLNPDYEGDGICGDPRYLDTFSLDVWEMDFELKYAPYGFFPDDGMEVIAWAEKPEPYRPEAKDVRD